MANEGRLTSSEPQIPYLGATVIVKAEEVASRLTVGRYEIVEELGRGGMGVVYKAFDPGIGRTVALKVMSEQLARDTEFRSRFLREARGAGILQHPNIVTVHELGEWQGAPFIAMEFLEGRSLEEILRNEPTMFLEQRLEIVAQVCRGLDYAHARGIVHRDIKPANVMVTKDGVAKIVDFGIARLADHKLTNTGQVLGTVSYMSPELLHGQQLDGRSDIFAVGVMLFEVLTSILPFAAEDTGTAITNILYKQPPKLSGFLSGYPTQLDDILDKCLAKDRTERFQKAGEIAEQLGRVCQDMQGSRIAPTVIRSTPLATDAFKPLSALPWQKPNSTATVSKKIRQMAIECTDFVQEWWKAASPRGRRNALTAGGVGLLYLIAIQLVAIPIAILTGLVLAAQSHPARKWWKEAPIQARAAVGVFATVIAAFCVLKLGTGIMWYVGGMNLMAIPVGAVIVTMIVANSGLLLDWWKSTSGKGRVVGIILSAFFAVCAASAIVNWSSTPKSYFARGGEFEQREKINQAILKDQSEAYASTPLQIWTDTSLLAKVQFYRPRLMWTNKDNGNQVTWAEANGYCSALRLGDYTDWHLPSVNELKRIADGKRGFDENVMIHHVKKGIFLSGTGMWGNTDATGVDFNSQDEGGGRALCVRVDNGQLPTQRSQASALPAKQVPPTDTSANALGAPVTPGLEGIFSNSGLMWQIDAGKAERTWSQSDAYCRDLRLGGFSDWRLATLDELESVYAHLDQLRLPSSVIWSSERTADAREGWYFYFLQGLTKKRYTAPVNETQRSEHALCVRGTFTGEFHNSEKQQAEQVRMQSAITQHVQEQQENAYASATQGVWIDPSVGKLMWMRKDNGRDVSWVNAQGFCRASRLSGYSDWRLPTTLELKAIYDAKAQLDNFGGSAEWQAYEDQQTYHVKKGIYFSPPSKWAKDQRSRPPVVWSSEEAKGFDFVSGSPTDGGARALCLRNSN